MLPSTADHVRAGAREAGVTMSSVLRDLLTEYAHGRSANPAVRADMVVVRQMANVFMAYAEGLGESEHAARLLAAARRLRDLAARHLGPSS